MSAVDYYALYYDLLYSHRDVRAEVDFLERMFREHSAIPVRSVLDVGCGTGIHSAELARRGYRVVGVDSSPEMVRRACEKCAGLEGVSFINADIRSLRLDARFDAAIAMYGVVSYFVDDDHLLEALRSVRSHLNAGGVFVFDTWNVAGVQEKRLYYETPSVELRRSGSMLAIKEEVWTVDLGDQTALLDITWSVIDLPAGRLESFSHRIKLRLFSPREIRHYLREAGFEVRALFEDYTCKPFTELSAEMVVVARAL